MVLYLINVKLRRSPQNSKLAAAIAILRASIPLWQDRFSAAIALSHKSVIANNKTKAEEPKEKLIVNRSVAFAYRKSSNHSMSVQKPCFASFQSLQSLPLSIQNSPHVVATCKLAIDQR